ncbi:MULTISPECIES: gliding motility-associated C-terminal domain-containing protein [unclassified Mucilaginibacter]|uniref:T9SS type B sorting domain-containing protein n=1 Tax=unclassified Mucilaginibacter TaxID=2617802 RepID=UPI002AC9813C|nr:MULTISPECIES: gliding motility-associated C-terminal domain-containing protein [unclassified Mucilaginibacter]MEB0261181.1 gliding motility-associated C-terminal domain-containing protein [Mucilaginibacter sp. 10I4]MEB0280354.1 gliding motility-associated C-terminal domain-containing protein [Mucilaginibacter sp. 10B2]MEB0300375.1 gliding motility-associated C-terminal domain-containing protein [Mucilaginibacter sp. 5C4]WPX24555.1 gliding motility-associated C-terminal domain-containing prot
MPVNKLKFLIFLGFLFINVQVFAQVSDGSLGDPVFTQDFGSATRAAVALSTNYTFTTNTCPPDGSYAVASSTNGCFGNNWHTVTHDHTGDPGGYMMIVNASYNKGEFFKQQIDVGTLCENTKYEFSAYILNLIVPKGDATIKPNISFIIEKVDGTLIKQYDTGDIPESAAQDAWVKYGTTFTTKPGVTQVVIRIVNNADGGNGNDLLLDDIAFRAYGPVIQAGIGGNVSFTKDNVCQSNAASYHLTSTPATGYSDAKYQWQLSTNNGDTWADINNETGQSLDRVFPADAVLGAYQYRLGAAEGENINSLKCRVYSNIVTISVTAYPVVNGLPSQQPICEGDALTLTATGGATYKWTGPNLPETSQNQLIIPNMTADKAGTYHVDVISAAGCITPKNVTVIVNAKPVINVSGPQTICAGIGSLITASAPDAVTYSWLPAAGLSDPNSATPFANPSVSTLYTVTVTSAGNCFSTKTVQVDVLPVPIVNAGGDKKIFEGQSVKLDGSATGDIATYNWSPADYLDDPHSLTPVATPLHDITYTLTVTSGNNCGEKEDKVFIRVYEKLVIPSSFTPNSDGINDIWNIEALETYADCVISVYTRTGKRVYQSRGYGKPWDGRLNGSQLPADTYYYVIDLKNGTPNLSGWVLLMR